MAKITFLAENNCVASSIAGTSDALAIANLWWLYMKNGTEKPLFETEIISIDGKPVTAQGGIILTPSRAMDDLEKTDLILLPTFFPPFDMGNPRLKRICEWTKHNYNNGNKVACNCTGTFLLAETGLLDGRIATTNWHFAEIFKRKYPKVSLKIDRLLTEDNGLYCTGAATAFMNLCLYLIARYGSPELASRCAKGLLVDTDRQSQSPYIVYEFWKKHSDGQILKAQQWMDKNYEKKFSIDTVAESIGISPRHFKRRFKNATGETPIAYLQRLRIENAKWMLERTSQNINEITWKVGYDDINSFRRLFLRHTGLSPKGYRNKFSSIH
ncbi:MAG: helix-turn-helix domain-containing protein [Desulfamplus sp.]|nr:helix-turn-helix domain-containing protein [Desulfamplus sp.]